ncbi:MAG: twin-arginine translocase subunit TatC [Opitutales bacterium]
MKHLPIDDEEEMPAEDKRSAMGFLDHLEELRWTLFKCAAAFFVAVVIIGVFLKGASEVMNMPYERATAALGIESGGLFMTSPMGVFSVLIQVCFVGGLGLSLPFMLFFLGRFVAPALKKEEIGMLLPACFVAFILFLSGAAFSYFFIVPEALKFSIRLNQMLGFEIIWSADRYYGLLVWTVLGMGFCFQFPLIVYILVYLRIVTTDKLIKVRPYMIVFFFVMGMILTPTWDPVTQTMVAVPMWLLYELSLFLARRLERRRINELEDELGEIEEDEGED